MTTRFSTKDPDEDVTVEFDFVDFGTPSAPDIEIGVIAGADATPEAIRLGSPSIIGTKVYQRITGGIDEVEYELRCFGAIGQDRVLIDAILPIRRRPGAAPA